MKQAKFLVNGKDTSFVSITDRGLAYGDGVFETILVVNGICVLWQEHINRLRWGIQRLKLPYIPDRGLEARVATLINQFRQANPADEQRLKVRDEKCIVKVIITRGSGGRGYFPRNCADANEIIACFPYTTLDSEIYSRGIDVRILATPTVSHLQLSGIKHLGRLEQVLASAELSETEFEGIMCDQNGHLIEGTRSNIILKRYGVWITPSLDRSGIRGVLREYLLKGDVNSEFTIEETDIGQAECSSVQAMAMVNSVFGVIPVRKIDRFELDVDCVIKEIQKPIHQSFCY